MLKKSTIGIAERLGLQLTALYFFSDLERKRETMTMYQTLITNISLVRTEANGFELKSGKDRVVIPEQVGWELIGIARERAERELSLAQYRAERLTHALGGNGVEKDA